MRRCPTFLTIIFPKSCLATVSDGCMKNFLPNFFILKSIIYFENKKARELCSRAVANPCFWQDSRKAPIPFNQTLLVESVKEISHFHCFLFRKRKLVSGVPARYEHWHCAVSADALENPFCHRAGDKARIANLAHKERRNGIPPFRPICHDFSHFPSR